MKKVILLTILFWYTLCVAAQETNFRNTTWGMSPDEVKIAEIEPIFDDFGDLLLYTTKVSGMDALIGYVFVNDKLTSSEYKFTEKYSNKNQYIDQYESVIKLLTKKYGEPTRNVEFWDDDLFKSDRSKWGLAISIGHLSYITTWEDKETTIGSGLLGNNHEIEFRVQYLSKELRSMEKDKREKDVLKDF